MRRELPDPIVIGSDASRHPLPGQLSLFAASVGRAKPPCGFCHGRPVGNAARWTSLGAPEYAPCPRCGQTNL